MLLIRFEITYDQYRCSVPFFFLVFFHTRHSIRCLNFLIFLVLFSLEEILFIGFRFKFGTRARIGIMFGVSCFSLSA